jgi:hypothetical protein
VICLKKLLLTVGIIFVLTFASAVAVYGANVNVNGSNVSFTDATGYPYVDENNRTQVPLRVTMEQAGAKVTWDQTAKIATIEKGGNVVKVPIGVNYILVNDKQVSIDTAAVIKAGRTYLPIRAVLEAVGFGVKWDNTTQTVFAANYNDYLGNQAIVVEQKRQSISSVSDLLDYLVSAYRLEKDKNDAVKLADRDYIDNFSKVSGTVTVSYSDWYSKDMLGKAGITLDDSGFTASSDADFNYTYGGKLVLKGNGKTVTINVPKFTSALVYNEDDDNNSSADYKGEAAKTFDGVAIYFSFTEMEFKGADLYKLGLIK